MKPIVIDALLIAAIAAAWLAALGFARLRTPLDRLHCAPFVNAVSGTALALAAVVSDGMAIRPLKLIFIVLVNLIAGAAMSHTVGRAAARRGEKP
jgi:multisubunit Na+/H+ antiporter MnhG subunit